MAMNGIELLSYEKGDQKPEWGILWRLFKKIFWLIGSLQENMNNSKIYHFNQKDDKIFASFNKVT